MILHTFSCSCSNVGQDATIEDFPFQVSLQVSIAIYLRTRKQTKAINNSNF